MDRLLAAVRIYWRPSVLWRNVKWRFPRRASDLPVVFVVGSPRSGTTLIQRVLASHSAMFSVESETGLFTHQNIFDPERRHFGLSRDEIDVLLEASTDVVDFFERAVVLLQARRGSRRFVEKTPQHVLRLGFILRYLPKARVVHVVRDGRDCLCSARSNPDVPQNGSAALFAAYWRRCVRAAMARAGEPRLLTTRYEDFTASPAQELNRVMRFLGLEAEDAQLDPAVVGQDGRSQLKPFSRLGQPVDTKSVRRWMSELTGDERATFDAIAGAELRHYGYEA